MKRRLLILGLLWISLGGTVPLSAFSSFRLFKAPNGKLILLIGDVRYDDSIVDCHVTTFLNRVTEGKCAQPLEILVEIPDPLPKVAWKANPSFERVLALKLQVDKQPSSSLRFTSCEPRGFISEHLETLRTELCEIALEVATDDDYKNAYNLTVSPFKRIINPWGKVKARELLRIKKETKSAGKTIPVTTVKDYFASLTEGLNQLDIIRQRYQDDKMIYDLFEQYYRRYAESLTSIQKSLRRLPARL